MLGRVLKNGSKLLRSLICLTQPKVSQRHHIAAVNLIAFLEILIEDQKIWQGNGKIIPRYFIIEMLQYPAGYPHGESTGILWDHPCAPAVSNRLTEDKSDEY